MKGPEELGRSWNPPPRLSWVAKRSRAAGVGRVQGERRGWGWVQQGNCKEGTSAKWWLGKKKKSWGRSVNGWWEPGSGAAGSRAATSARRLCLWLVRARGARERMGGAAADDDDRQSAGIGEQSEWAHACDVSASHSNVEISNHKLANAC